MKENTLVSHLLPAPISYSNNMYRKLCFTMNQQEFNFDNQVEWSHDHVIKVSQLMRGGGRDISKSIYYRSRPLDSAQQQPLLSRVINLIYLHLKHQHSCDITLAKQTWLAQLTWNKDYYHYILFEAEIQMIEVVIHQLQES